jgi:hypothetical protein
MANQYYCKAAPVVCMARLCQPSLSPPSALQSHQDKLFSTHSQLTKWEEDSHLKVADVHASVSPLQVRRPLSRQPATQAQACDP